MRILAGMTWGCLSFLILFPVGIFIWAAGEKHRRAALPPEELKTLEAEENYGPLDEKLECIFCHSKNGVRARSLNGSLEELMSGEDFIRSKHWKSEPIVALLNPKEYIDPLELQKIQTVKAHCMNCGNDWELFAPDQ